MEIINFKKILDIIEKRILHVIGIILVFIIIGCLYSFFMVEEKYESYTTFILGTTNKASEKEENETQLVQSEKDLDSNKISTYNEIIKSTTSIREIKNNLRTEINEEKIKDAINISRVNKTEIVKITVKYPNKELAKKIASETLNVFSEKIEDIYKIDKIYIIDAAVIAEEPYNVHHFLDITIFTILGILTSFVYCIIISVFDKKIKSTEIIEEEISLKLLALIPNNKNKKQNLESLIDFKKEKSPILEAFKTLRTNIQFINIHKKTNKVMLVTSCFESEGKSYIAANLAAVFAEAGKKVILIDMNMKTGSQDNIFKIPNNLGISNYLSNIGTNGMEINERINSYIKETSVKNLNIITSGSIPPNSSDLLTSDKLPELIKDLSVFYDLIIFDGPSVGTSIDSLILTKISGSTILVSSENKTRKEELRKLKKDIENVGGRVIGFVLNQATSKNKFSKKIYQISKVKKEQKLDKNKKENDIKNIILKIKKWLQNISIYKKKETQLLLEQRKEILDKKEENINKKEVLEEKSIEIKESLKVEEKNEENLNKLQKEIVEKAKTKDLNNENKEEVKLSKIDNIELEKTVIEKEEKNNIENLSEEVSKTEENKDKKSSTEQLNNLIDDIKDELKLIFEKLSKMSKGINEKVKKSFKSVSKKIRSYRIKNLEEKQEKQKQKEEEIKKEEQRKKVELEEAKKEEIILEKIKEEEKIIQEKKDQEEKLQKELLKKDKKDKRKKAREEKRKNKEQKKQKQKEEARINEELLEDNLYPKTKYNKNL